MSTTHGQPGLSSDQRSDIRRTILSTRRAIEEELRRQLEFYGIYEDERLDPSSLGHLSVAEYRTRETIDAALERELESTEGDLERSITNYVREATKTYLNRFVALKAIEVRGLVEETIAEQTEYGNRSYMHYTVDEIAGELTEASDDGYGVALDVAYQEIGAEIRMIFEDDEHTVIDLDPQVREEVLDSLQKIDDEAWESDEALGWVYQYFGEEEREEIDERVDEENYKIAGTDIATKTQLFTPRYIVEWMVDNSLGRTWLEMQGDATNIDDEDHCFYLAPLEESLLDRDPKPVEEITVLDPACGSGHMLFYAFDVLYQMYLEEGETPEAYIPREILRNNLYGIDIDSGAAQIAALSLYLKAKDRSPDVEIPQLNIVSADAVLINGDRKEAVLDRAKSDLEREILEQIWRSFGNIRELGSLVQVEDRIDELIDEYREEFEAAGQVQFTSDGEMTSQSSFVTEGEAESWEGLKERLLENVRELAKEGLEQNDPIEEMFADEVGKTVELVDLLIHKYTIVVSNPPYLSSGKMGSELKTFLKDNFDGYRNIYTSFIERCAEMTTNEGYATLVTPHDFMSLYSFRKLRSELVSKYQFIEAAHLAGFSFSMKDRPFTIPFVLRKSQPNTFDHSRFYRLTHEQSEYNSHKKTIQGLNDVITSLRLDEVHKDVYVFDQNIFSRIDRTPMNIYYLGGEILSLFGTYSPLSEVAEVKKGLSTGNDGRFVRKMWEIPEDGIDKYALLQKSGTQEPYKDVPVDFVNWNLRSEMEDAAGGRVQNSDYYFKDGVTFRGFGDQFTARNHTSDMIFDQKAHFVYSEDIPDSQLLAIMNSTISRYIMRAINPGVDFNVGDGKRLPIKKEFDQIKIVKKLVETALKCQKERYSLRDWCMMYSVDKFSEKIETSIYDIQYEEELNHAVLLVVTGLIDEIVFEEYNISKQVKEQTYQNLPQNLFEYHSEDISDLMGVGDIYKHLINHSKKINDDVNLTGDSLRQISEKIQTSPISVANERNNSGQYHEETQLKTVEKVTSFCLGTLFGRWENSEEYASVEDEILSFADSSSRGVADQLSECLFKFDAKTLRIRSELDQATDGDWIQWVRESFFEDYHCKEYRRRGQRIPIYWQLESPNGAFSCFIYYHGIDANTLPKLRGQYLDPRINELQNELDTLRAQTQGENPDTELLDRREEVEEDLDDIETFRDIIDEMIDDGITVDVEEGIWENIKRWDQYEILQTGLPKLKSSYSR